MPTPKRPRKPAKPLPRPGVNPMPKRLDARKAAIVAWCNEHPDDPTAADILETLGFAEYAREAWDSKCRSRTYRELWDKAAGTPPPPPPQPGVDPMPHYMEDREEALRAWCERNAANPMAQSFLAELGNLTFGMDREEYGSALRDIWDRAAEAAAE